MTKEQIKTQIEETEKFSLNAKKLHGEYNILRDKTQAEYTELDNYGCEEAQKLDALLEEYDFVLEELQSTIGQLDELLIALKALYEAL